MSAESIATAAAAVGLLAVLLPLLLTIRADVGEVRRDLHALAAPGGAPRCGMPPAVLRSPISLDIRRCGGGVVRVDPGSGNASA